MYWYKRAAQQNNVDAQLAIANAYESGDGVGKDLAEAFVWYERAAQNESLDAGMKVAEFYEKGLGGITKNPAKAIELYKALAKGEANDAQIKLAKMYVAGELNDVDIKDIVNWLQLAEDDSLDAKTN